MNEDFCGIAMDVSLRETAKGTKYNVCKWMCPTCKKECAMVEIDGEWSFGDGVVSRCKGGKHSMLCSSCWLQEPTDER